MLDAHVGMTDQLDVEPDFLTDLANCARGGVFVGQLVAADGKPGVELAMVNEQKPTVRVVDQDARSVVFDYVGILPFVSACYVVASRLKICG